jgi:hypothetical protein
VSPQRNCGTQIEFRRLFAADWANRKLGTQWILRAGLTRFIATS